MALAIDASTPATKGGAVGTSITSNSFSPPANSVIVVCVAGDGPSNAVQSVSSMTDSLGSHLTWALLVRSNTDSSAGSTVGGTTEIWWAACPSAQTNMTVTANFARTTGGTSTPDSLILPIVFTGAATTQNGATNPKSATTAAAPSQSVTTTANGSWVIGVILNYLNGTGPTVPGGQTTTINGSSGQQLNGTAGDGFWVQIQTATTTSSGTVVAINDTAPTMSYNMVVAEILAGAGGGGSSSPAPPPARLMSMGVGS